MTLTKYFCFSEKLSIITIEVVLSSLAAKVIQSDLKTSSASAFEETFTSLKVGS